jgi:hypothetical protein
MVGRGRKLTPKQLRSGKKVLAGGKTEGVLDAVERGIDSPRSQRRRGVTQGSGMTLRTQKL